MASKRLIASLAMLAFILSGCFRQASEPVDTVAESGTGGDNAAQQQDGTPTAAPAETTAAATTAVMSATPRLTATQTAPPASATTEATATETESGLTVITSTPVVAATDTPQPTATATQRPTRTERPSATASPDAPPTIRMMTGTPIPTRTPTPRATATSDDDTDSAVLQSEPTIGIITPSSPNESQSAITTPTPRPGVDATNTPSGLVTPTDMFAQPDATQDDQCIYVVQPGDNLFRIAINNDTTLDAVVEANPGIQPELIQPGDEITLPNCDEDALPTPTPTTASQTGDSGVTGAVPVEGEDDGDDQGIIEDGVQQVYTVQSGDTLGSIARRFSVTISAIVEANELTNPDQLSVGQELVIPPAEGR